MNSEGVVKLERVRVRCPGCGEEVEAVAADGRVKGYCAVARRYVDFVAETQRIQGRIGKEPTAETAEISSVKKQWQDPEVKDVVRDYLAGVKIIVIQLKHGISPGKMYRILGGANVELRSAAKTITITSSPTKEKNEEEATK